MRETSQRATAPPPASLASGRALLAEAGASLLACCSRTLVAACDRGYRWLHQLDAPGARVGPALCLRLQASRRDFQLVDGTAIRRGDPLGILHLNNRQALQLHRSAGAARAVGIGFRRRFVASLTALAAQAGAGGAFDHVRAFGVTTIFGGLHRVGFAEASGDVLSAAALIAAYQRALIALLHPAGRARLQRIAARRARRLWISRRHLLALYAAAPADPCHTWSG